MYLDSLAPIEVDPAASFMMARSVVMNSAHVGDISIVALTAGR